MMEKYPWICPHRAAQIAEAILACLKKLHSIGWIHQDIKPDNILRDNKDPNKFNLIDLGCAYRYRDEFLENHVKSATNVKPTGTWKYMTINQHCHYRTSRRDDLEQLAYTIIDIANGLPWKNHTAKLYDIKIESEVPDICNGLPEVFAEFLNYARNLGFYTKPKYSKWIHKFKRINEESYCSNWQGDCGWKIENL